MAEAGRGRHGLPASRGKKTQSLNLYYLSCSEPGTSISVGDPELDLDPHVFWPPGSGSISPRYGTGTRSFLFLIKVLS